MKIIKSLKKELMPVSMTHG